MNEVGVDPGIDHMLAMQCFDEVKRAGGKVSNIFTFSTEGSFPCIKFYKEMVITF